MSVKYYSTENIDQIIAAKSTFNCPSCLLSPSENVDAIASENRLLTLTNNILELTSLDKSSNLMITYPGEDLMFKRKAKRDVYQL